MNDQPTTVDPAPKPTIDVAAGVRAMGPLLTVLTILTVTAPMLGGFAIIGFAKKLQPWVRDHGTNGLLIFGLAFGVTTGLALMPTYALSFASGVFFGFWRGFGIAMAGIMLGSLIGYTWGATAARKRVMQLIESNERARIVRAALIDRTFGRSLATVILLRIPPNSPFALTNLVMSSTRVNPLAFALGTLIGIAPRTAFAAWFGSQVGELDKAKMKGDLQTRIIVMAVCVVGFFIVYRILSRWAKRALAERLRGPGTPSSSDEAGVAALP